MNTTYSYFMCSVAEYGELDIVTEIKKGRLRWLGHVERMCEERVVKRLYQNTPEGSRSVGRPRLR